LKTLTVTLMDTLFGGQDGGQATEEETSERAAEQAHQTPTVVKTVVNAEKDEAQAAAGLGFSGGDGGESNSPSKQASETICYRHSRRFGDARRPLIGGLLSRLPTGS
jgi:hypothetical protein